MNRRIRIGILASSCVLFASFIVQADVIPVGGGITEDTTWTSGNVYHITDWRDFTIQEGVTLTVEAGAVVKLLANRINVDGTLLVEGTAENPAVFTSQRDDTYGGDSNGDGNATTPAPGDWHAVNFGPAATGRISGTIFKWGGGNYYYWDTKAMVRVSSSDVVIDGCTFSNSGYFGIYTDGVGITVQNCRFEDNALEALRIYRGSPTVPILVEGCTFKAVGAGGGRVTFDGEPVADIRFTGNRAETPCAVAFQGPAGGDIYWEAEGGLVFHAPDLTVNADETLTLSPGTILKSAWEQGLYISGALVAEGTPDSPIIFTSWGDDNYGGDTNHDGGDTTPGSWPWDGITFHEGSHGLIREAVVAWGAGNYYHWDTKANVRSWSSDVTLENVVIRDSNLDGIYAENCGMRATRCTFQNCNRYAVRNVSDSLWIDARYSWWDDPTGPHHPENNPNGQGESVSDYVLFFPWAEDSSGTVSGLYVLVGGPGSVSPGQTTDYTVSYANYAQETLEDAVLVFSLPYKAEFVESTGDGIHRFQTHEVFWKLGDLPQGIEGIVTLRVRYQWGIPSTFQDDVIARFAGSSTPDPEVDVADYLAYEPLEVVGQSTLTEAEFAAERAQWPDLEILYQRLVSDGFTYQASFHAIMSEGEPATQVILRRPYGSAVAFLHRRGDTALLWRIEGNESRIEAVDGAKVVDMTTYETRFEGAWADAEKTFACDRKTCIRNCLAVVVATEVATGLAVSAYLGWASYLIAPKVLFAGAIVLGCDIGVCGAACAYDPSYACCDGPYIVPAPLSGGKVCMRMECNSAQILSPIPSFPICTNGRCVYGHGCVRCKEPWEESAGAKSGGANCCHKTDLVVAKDPNAKYGPEGDALPGQWMDYRITCENEGAGTAYGVFITDVIAENLDGATVQPQDGGIYVPGSRTAYWEIGELAPKGEPGSEAEVNLRVRVKDGLPSGTVIINDATVYFPSVPEETPTNPVVHIVSPVVATPQSLEMDCCGPLAITLAGADMIGTPLTFAVVDPPFFGLLSGAGPNLVYTPVEGFSGLDRFTYTADNGTMASRPAEVQILVNPDPNDATPPGVRWTDPVQGAVEENIERTPLYEDEEGPVYAPFITAGFSEALGPETLDEASFRVELQPSGRLLAGDVEWDEALWRAVLKPREPWSGGTYRVTVAGTVTDLVGNPMGDDYTWTFQIKLAPGSVPGDCDGSGAVSIGEVQKAINMHLRRIPPDCGVDCDGNGTVSIGELQKVINAHLQLPSSC